MSQKAGLVNVTEVGSAGGGGIWENKVGNTAMSCRSIMLPPRRTGPADTARGARRAAIENLKNSIFVGGKMIVGTSLLSVLKGK